MWGIEHNEILLSNKTIVLPLVSMSDGLIIIMTSAVTVFSRKQSILPDCIWVLDNQTNRLQSQLANPSKPTAEMHHIQFCQAFVWFTA